MTIPEVDAFSGGDHSRVPDEPIQKGNEAFAFQRVQHLLGALGGTWRADHERADAWWRFDETHWSRVNGNDPIKRALTCIYNEWRWIHRSRHILLNDIELLRAEVGPEMGCPSSKLIPFTNGCLDWTTGAMHPHDPKNWNRYCLPYGYEPAATDPKTILWFLKDRLEYEEVISMIRSFIWHVLTGKTMKCFLEISGPGNTGKSVLATLIEAAIGKRNIIGMKLSRLEDPSQRFETYKMRDKRLLICSESQGYSGPMEQLKAVTGGDLISAERKNSTEEVDFVFNGGVMLVGNSPVRPSDVTSAVVDRRRSIRVTRIVEDSKQRDLLRYNNESRQFEGEMVPELGAFIKWVLAMDPADARKAISRDITSLARAEAEKEVLLSTDRLAEWANECLIFDDQRSQNGEVAIRTNVGKIEGPGSDPSEALLPNYRQWMTCRENKGMAYGQNNFNDKLVSLLRETLKLPLPQGPLKTGEYKVRGIGSVVPYIRLRRRDYDDGMPGVVDQAFGRQVPVTTGNDQKNDQNPVGNGGNGRNDQAPLIHVKKEDSEQEAATHTGIGRALEAVSRPSRSSRYCRSLEGSQGELPISGSLHIDPNDSTGSGFDVEAS